MRARRLASRLASRPARRLTSLGGGGGGPTNISNFVINADGLSGSFDVADWSGGLPTGFESGKTARVNITSQGRVQTELSAGAFGGQATLYYSSASIASSSLYIDDTFTEASNTALGSHTPDTDVEAGGWSALLNGGTPIVNSAGYLSWTAITGGGQWDQYSIDSGQADGRVSCQWTSIATNNRCAIVFRAADSSNYWRLENLVGTSVSLVKVVAGTPTTVATISGTDVDGDSNFLVAGQTEDQSVVFSGNAIEVYFHGKLKMTATDSALSSNTRVGLGTRSTSPRVNFFKSGSIAGTLTVNFELQDYSADDDTVSLTASNGLVASGESSSLVASSVSGTNSSTQADLLPVCRHAFAVDNAGQLIVPFQVASGNITVDVLAAHGAGIAAVKVDITDGTTTLSNTQTALSLSNYSDGVFGAECTTQGYTYNGTGVYKCGPFDLSQLDDGRVTVTCTAYPRRGGATRSDSFVLNNNSGSTLTQSNKYVDSTGTLTLSGVLTNDVLDNQLVTGGTSGAIAVTRGASANGASSLPVHWMNGTFSASETLTITDYKGDTVATATFSSASWNGSDSNDGSSGTPYRTVLAGINGILASDDYGTVYVKGRCRTPASAPEVQNVCMIDIRQWPSEVGSVCANGAGASSKVRHLRYFCDINIASDWGTGQDSVALFSGSGTTTESSVVLAGTVYHARGREGTRLVSSKPINGTAFINPCSYVSMTARDMGTDAFGVQGARFYARDCLGLRVSNNWSFNPHMMLNCAGRDCILAQDRFFAQSGTLVGTPAIGDIVYDAVTGSWVTLTDYVPSAANLFIFDRSAGGGAATSSLEFTETGTTSFYDPTNFDTGTGLPTGSADGTFNFGVVHPDGIQYGQEAGTNTAVANILLSENDGQLYYATNEVSSLCVNFLGVRIDGAAASTSNFGAHGTTGDYSISRHGLVWHSSFPNQRLRISTDDAPRTRLGMQIVGCVASQFTGEVGDHGSLVSSLVARQSGSAAAANATVAADVFENGVNADADYSAATNDYRPTGDMPTTSDIRWAYDMLGNLRSGTTYCGAIEETA